MMAENNIDSDAIEIGEEPDYLSSEGSSEESAEESLDEEKEEKKDYLEEEKPSSNEVDLGGDRRKPKRRNWFDRCGDCVGVPEDQVHPHNRNQNHNYNIQVCGSDGKTYENSCELEYFSCRRYWAITEVKANFIITTDNIRKVQFF